MSNYLNEYTIEYYEGTWIVDWRNEFDSNDSCEFDTLEEAKEFVIRDYENYITPLPQSEIDYVKALIAETQRQTENDFVIEEEE